MIEIGVCVKRKLKSRESPSPLLLFLRSTIGMLRAGSDFRPEGQPQESFHYDIKGLEAGCSSVSLVRPTRFCNDKMRSYVHHIGVSPSSLPVVAPPVSVDRTGSYDSLSSAASATRFWASLCRSAKSTHSV